MNTISIIVPIYNCESTLTDCLDSIVAQTYSELEILLVDDGSSDQSGTICKNYVNKYHNMMYYKKEHTGVSHTREYGIAKATGSYIGFVDADDTIHPSMYLNMYHKLQQEHSMICICGYESIIENIKTTYISDNIKSPMSPVTCMQNMCATPYIEGFMWNKLYISDILKSLIWNNDIPVCEDLNANIRLLHSLPGETVISYLPISLYHYVKKEHSLTCSSNLFFNHIFLYEPAFYHIWNEIGTEYFIKNNIPIFCKYVDILQYAMYLLLNTSSPDMEHARRLRSDMLRFYSAYHVHCNFSIREHLHFIIMAKYPLIYRRLRLHK